MFFDPRVNHYGTWILWGALLVLGLSGQGCSSIPRSQEHGMRRGLFDVDRASQHAAAPVRIEQSPGTDSHRMRAREVSSIKRDLIEESLPPKAKIFSWPLKEVSITSHFGRRNRRAHHQGLDLRASVGTPVFAAHAGRVIYVGSRIAGYGKLVVIKDSRGYSTIYAHNSKLLVLPGQQVERGQKISLSGATGTVRGAHLHFEIRRGVTPQDPEKLLSRR